MAPALALADATPIGFVRHNFLPPSETFIYQSMSGLTRHRVRVFTLRRLTPDKFPWPDVTELAAAPMGWLESIWYRLTRRSPRMRRWGRSVKLLHAHMGNCGLHALATARFLGVPLVTSFYGKDVAMLGGWGFFAPGYVQMRLMHRALFAGGQRFLVLSRHMQQALEQHGCPPEKLRVVRLGIDLARFDARRASAPAPGRATVLMVGREVEKKGFDDGLAACAFARAQGVDLRVVLLGTGDHLRGRLVRQAQELGLEVEWPDPRTRVPQAMAEADILLVPSRTARNGDQEGTPTVICEGSAARLPIVATRHAGIPEQVVDGETGLLADERDVAGLGQALVSLARDPARRAAMGEAGRQKMTAEYALAVHTRRLEEVYDEVLREQQS